MRQERDLLAMHIPNDCEVKNMSYALRGALYEVKRRKGSSIVESLILMIIIGITFGAIFTTMGWAHRTHMHSRHDRESRELLSSWVQVFDAKWQPALDDNNVNALQNRAANAITDAVNMMGGAPPTVVGGVFTANVNGFTLQVTPVATVTPTDRSLELGILIQAGGRTLMDFREQGLRRRFSGFPNDMVRDWREQ